MSKPQIADLNLLAEQAAHFGPQWGQESEDLNITLLTWEAAKRIEAHVNTEVDVVVIGVEGRGTVTVDGEALELKPGVAMLIPKGCERAFVGGPEKFSYLSIHRRRRGLMPTSNIKRS